MNRIILKLKNKANELAVIKEDLEDMNKESPLSELQFAISALNNAISYIENDTIPWLKGIRK